MFVVGIDFGCAYSYVVMKSQSDNLNYITISPSDKQESVYHKTDRHNLVGIPSIISFSYVDKKIVYHIGAETYSRINDDCTFSYKDSMNRYFKEINFISLKTLLMENIINNVKLEKSFTSNNDIEIFMYYRRIKLISIIKLKDLIKEFFLKILKCDLEKNCNKNEKVKFVIGIPTIFSSDNNEQCINAYKSYLETIFKSICNDIHIDVIEVEYKIESYLAGYPYFINNQSINNFVTVDLGGGTTDVTIFQNDLDCIHNGFNNNIGTLIDRLFTVLLNERQSFDSFCQEFLHKSYNLSQIHIIKENLFLRKNDPYFDNIKDKANKTKDELYNEYINEYCAYVYSEENANKDDFFFFFNNSYEKIYSMSKYCESPSLDYDSISYRTKLVVENFKKRRNNDKVVIIKKNSF